MEFGKIAVCFMFLASLASFGFATGEVSVPPMPDVDVDPCQPGETLLLYGQTHVFQQADSFGNSNFSVMFVMASQMQSSDEQGHLVNNYIGTFKIFRNGVFPISQVNLDGNTQPHIIKISDGSLVIIQPGYIGQEQACIRASVLLPESNGAQLSLANDLVLLNRDGSQSEYRLDLITMNPVYLSTGHAFDNMCWVFGSQEMTYAPYIKIYRNDVDITPQLVGAPHAFLTPPVSDRRPLPVPFYVPDENKYIIVGLEQTTENNAMVQASIIPLDSCAGYPVVPIGGQIPVINGTSNFSMVLNNIRGGPYSTQNPWFTNLIYSATVDIYNNGELAGQVQISPDTAYTFASSATGDRIKIRMCQAVNGTAWIRASVPLGCTDTDGGLDEFVQGQASEVWSDGTVMHTWLQTNDTDYCMDSTQLREFYCDNNSIARTSVTCANGCVDGACVQPVASTPIGKAQNVAEKPAVSADSRKK